MDDYPNAPLTLGEIRSEKHMSAAEWSPRDALIGMLRQIDSGELKPEALIVGWYVNGKSRGETITSFRVACPSVLCALGLIEMVKAKMLER